MKSLFILLTLSSAVFADHECLIKATNQELLSEVSRRMGTPGTGLEKGSVILGCESYRLKMSVVSSSGKEGSGYMDGSSTTNCQSVLAQTGSAFEIYQSKIVAICESYRLKRSMLKAEGAVQTLTHIDYSNTNDCQAAADAINKKN